MKQQEDGHRRDVELPVGSFVVVKLQPYRQQTAARRVSHVSLRKPWKGLVPHHIVQLPSLVVHNQPVNDSR